VRAMTEPLRVAVVGAGMISSSMHVPAVLASPRARLIAIVDPARQRAEDLARKYGVRPAIATRVEDVLGDIDAAIIATPNYSHKEIALACLGAGVSTLIEKPLAASYDDGAAIVRAGQENGKAVAAGYLFRFRENILYLKELLGSGYFGTVRRFVRQAGTRGGWAPVSAYNLSRKESGGGVLVVSGTHFLDTMLHFWGYPHSMELEDDSRGGPEAHCVARFGFDRGGQRIEGVAISSKTVALPGGLVIETDQGIVRLDDDNSADILFRPRDKPAVELAVRRRDRPPFPRGMGPSLRQFNDFIDACHQKRPPMVDGNQGLLSLRLLDDLYARRKLVDPQWYDLVDVGVAR
jgi:predicted dehydrogenase